MGLRDKAAAFNLIERAMAVMSIEKDPIFGRQPIEILARWQRKPARPTADCRFTETALNTVREHTRCRRAAHSCIAPARSNPTPFSLRSRFPKTLQGKAAVDPGQFREGDTIIIECCNDGRRLKKSPITAGYLRLRYPPKTCNNPEFER